MFKKVITSLGFICLLSVLVACSGSKKTANGVSSKKTEKNYLKHSYKSLKKSLNAIDADISMINDTVKVIFNNAILFPFNSASVDSSMYTTFHKFAGVLNKYDKLKILINGHTDNTGEEQYNIKLSQQRADSAKVLLTSNKVQPERIFTWGHGMKQPVGNNATLEGRKRNRRVEFILLYGLKKD